MSGPRLMGKARRHSARWNRTGDDSEFSRRLRYGSACVSGLERQLLRRIGKDVDARLVECAPDANVVACITSCLAELRDVVRQLGPGWDVTPYGSAVSGFGTASSDLDVACCNYSMAMGAGSQNFAASILRDWLAPLLRQHSAFRVVEEVLSAKIPILRLRFGELEVDLSCYNPWAVINTQLLKAYSGIDDRVRQLGVAVKLWAKAANVCGASQSNLSSYAFTLLAIYFLQVQPDVQLPLLPSRFQRASSGDAGSTVAWKCTLSLSELVLRFFRFYATEFVWGAEVASIRCGVRLFSLEPIFAKLRGRGIGRLHIEDPCQSERNLNCVLGAAEEMGLRAAFGEAFCAILANGTPVGLRPTTERQARDAARPLREEAFVVATEMNMGRSTLGDGGTICGRGSPGRRGLGHSLALPEKGAQSSPALWQFDRPVSSATARIAARVAAVCTNKERPRLI